MDSANPDAASAIIAALATGAAAGVKDLAKDAVTSGPRRLLELIRSRFGRNSDELGNARLTVYAADPSQANAETLHGHIVGSGLDHDDEIVALAREILQQAGPRTTGDGSLAATSISQLNRDQATGFVGGQHVHHHGAPVPTKRVRWLIEHRGGPRYVLINAGDADAHDVELDLGECVEFITEESSGTWTVGSGRGFLVSRSLHSGPPRLAVTWRDADGQRYNWSYSL